MVKSPRRPLLLLLIIALALSLSCSGRQEAPRTADDEGGDEPVGAEPADGADGDGEGAEQGDSPSAVCRAYQDDEADALHRWIGAFQVGRGGVVLIFVGATAEQMDIEATLEMASIEGYENTSCGTAVVVWVPGMECDGRQDELASRIEEGTTMVHSETSCFRIDEVRQRIREECEQGILPAGDCP